MSLVNINHLRSDARPFLPSVDLVDGESETRDLNASGYNHLTLLPYYVRGGSGAASEITVKLGYYIDVSRISHGTQVDGSLGDLTYPFAEESASSGTVTMSERTYTFSVSATGTLPVIECPINPGPYDIRVTVSNTGGVTEEDTLHLLPIVGVR